MEIPDQGSFDDPPRCSFLFLLLLVYVNIRLITDIIYLRFSQVTEAAANFPAARRSETRVRGISRFSGSFANEYGRA